MTRAGVLQENVVVTPEKRGHSSGSVVRVLVLTATVFLYFSLFAPRAYGHWNPPDAPMAKVVTAGPTVLVQWDSSWLDWGYYFYYAPMDLAYIGQIHMGSARHILVDLWEGAAFFVGAKAYNDSGTGDYSNIGIVEVDYPPPQGVVVPDSGDVVLEIVETMDFGSVACSGVSSADNLSAGIRSLRGEAPSGEMTAAFNADGTPERFMVGTRGVAFTPGDDALSYELLGTAGDADVMDESPGGTGSTEAVLRGLVSDRIIAAVGANGEGTEPRWLSHIDVHPFHDKVAANPAIMTVVEGLFSARLMRHRLSTDVCFAETALAVCETRKESAGAALERLLSAVEETLDDLIVREWNAYTALALPITYGGIARIEAIYYGTSGEKRLVSRTSP